MTAMPLSAAADTSDTSSRVPPPYAHYGPALLATALERIPQDLVTRFTESWNDLPADAHLGTARPYRFRRYGRFRILGDRLERLPHVPFFQDRAVNKVNGGVERMFAPLDDAVAHGPALRAVVRTLRERLPGPRAGIDACGVHQIRVTATTDTDGHPAPEGVHRDGHSYVAQVLIRRERVRGAESCLYDDRMRPLHRASLTAPLETIVLDDRRVLHGVSPIRPEPGARTGLRDMLLVDFFPFDPGNESGASGV
ncbi:2OG-Fe dioxygenase family protein [Streptomyces sp. NPDC053048]|uniref:2OG-Fe dioxygenase family protein n=1 Tax=Streptomyces sp. NPDC053048 TaxID=3365694 RepID=UPI0037D556B3